MRGVTRALAALASILALLLSASVAGAQQVCVPRDAAVAQLERQYKETVVGRGLVESGNAMVELFVGDAGTWTVLVTDVNGQSCIAASGQSWSEPRLLVGDSA